jgi:hypothetical protein
MCALPLINRNLSHLVHQLGQNGVIWGKKIFVLGSRQPYWLFHRRWSMQRAAGSAACGTSGGVRRGTYKGNVKKRKELWRTYERWSYRYLNTKTLFMVIVCNRNPLSILGMQHVLHIYCLFEKLKMKGPPSLDEIVVLSRSCAVAHSWRHRSYGRGPT